jgi:hypothetical protein
MQSFRHFFRVIAPSPNKTNKFIPYHLFISKHKYYVTKLYMFHDLSLHYILWRLVILWRLSIYVTDRFFPVTRTHLIFHPIEKLHVVKWKIKWYTDQTWARFIKELTTKTKNKLCHNFLICIIFENDFNMFKDNLEICFYVRNFQQSLI